MNEFGSRRLIQTIVIIGGGLAGISAVAALRAEGYRGRLVLLSDEDYPPYDHPALTIEWLKGHTDLAELRLHEAARWLNDEVVLCLADPAVSVDPAGRQVVTASGRSFAYDRLILATGGEARRLSSAADAGQLVHYLRTSDDMLVLRHKLQPRSRLLIIGGGWVGLEVAAGARAQGHQVTLVEGLPRLCARSAPPLLSNYLLSLHRQQGIAMHLGTPVVGLHQTAPGQPIQVALAYGEELEVDVVVASIGVHPRVKLALAAGLEVEDGIRVDACGRTSKPDIFACGDVAHYPSQWLRRRTRTELSSQARQQGLAVARALLGKKPADAELPWFRSEQYGSRVQIMGDIYEPAQIIVRGSLTSHHAAIYYLDNRRLRGVVAVNAEQDMDRVKPWMLRQTEVTSAMLGERDEVNA